MELRIRNARTGDGRAIAECFYASCDNSCKDCFNKYICSASKYTVKMITNMDKRLSKKLKNYLALVAIDKNGKLVGFSSCLGSTDKSMMHRAECGWFVDINYANKGIATKLVERLIVDAKNSGFKKLEAEAAIENIASIRLAKKLGFEIEGTKKLALRIGSRYIDSYILGKVLN